MCGWSDKFCSMSTYIIEPVIRVIAWGLMFIEGSQPVGVTFFIGLTLICTIRFFKFRHDNLFLIVFFVDCTLLIHVEVEWFIFGAEIYV